MTAAAIEAVIATVLVTVLAIVLAVARAGGIAAEIVVAKVAGRARIAGTCGPAVRSAARPPRPLNAPARPMTRASWRSR
ncbi:hypothetical protein BJY21_000330 [Kineosphaera limosa]|uniref:Uncharacterized protein n=1 Tax=Kineosphaera limosa NBRC 100340 TaxID=1184609 RepID=K6WB87_9MICO|nr:hypothetical protein [Kineosphaera limosa]GAB96495.1 hypothetical protein KILIM_040_00050 [Kineosphaera limosa NBRC 100340]